MPLAQDQSLYLLASSPARYHCITDASCTLWTASGIIITTDITPIFSDSIRRRESYGYFAWRKPIFYFRYTRQNVSMWEALRKFWCFSTSGHENYIPIYPVLLKIFDIFVFYKCCETNIIIVDFIRWWAVHMIYFLLYKHTHKIWTFSKYMHNLKIYV